jgi:hypothetical protein
VTSEWDRDPAEWIEGRMHRNGSTACPPMRSRSRPADRRQVSKTTCRGGHLSTRSGTGDSGWSTCRSVDISTPPHAGRSRRLVDKSTMYTSSPRAPSTSPLVHLSTARPVCMSTMNRFVGHANSSLPVGLNAPADWLGALLPAPPPVGPDRVPEARAGVPGGCRAPPTPLPAPS